MLPNFNTIAAKNGHLDALRWLLVNGAQSLVNIPDRFGITPLYIACAETTPRFDVAATLILYGGMTSEGGSHTTRTTFTRSFGRGTSPSIKQELIDWARIHVVIHQNFAGAGLLLLKHFLPLDNVTAAAINTHIADFANVKRGTELRFLREFLNFAA